MKAYDAIETPSCPEEYPEDLVFDTWLGTREICDCLERPGARDVYYNLVCEKGGKGARHMSEKCHNVAAIAPTILNTFKGVRYCGRQS